MCGVHADRREGRNRQFNAYHRTFNISNQWKCRQISNRDVEGVNTINKSEIIDLCSPGSSLSYLKKCHLFKCNTGKIYISFKCIPACSKVKYILGHKVSSSKIKRIKIMQTIFFYQNIIKI